MGLALQVREEIKSVFNYSLIAANGTSDQDEYDEERDHT
jgi:hypothetical protein